MSWNLKQLKEKSFSDFLSEQELLRSSVDFGYMCVDMYADIVIEDINPETSEVVEIPISVIVTDIRIKQKSDGTKKIDIIKWKDPIGYYKCDKTKVKSIDFVSVNFTN